MHEVYGAINSEQEFLAYRARAFHVTADAWQSLNVKMFKPNDKGKFCHRTCRL